FSGTFMSDKAFVARCGVDTLSRRFRVIKNMPLIEALKFASATAAINITALGARGHLPTPSEVNLFLSQHD
ncbi:hypothetical protein R9U98_14850, partial [Escherichia coli]